MSTAAMRARPLTVMFVLGAIGCWFGWGRGPYYPYRYPWYYSSYGTYSVVRRPVVVVDGWTNRAFRYRPYRGYVVRRHASSPITYTAATSDDTLRVNLTAMGDSTRLEVQARDRERARDLMGEILKDYK
ncbi:MAG TPA: hypothetical protein VFT29_08860 [Gemmatimonadaceae bacterium]|nr:hypothetical protein [Gemmatimonadaceae bacterium]